MVKAATTFKGMRLSLNLGHNCPGVITSRRSKRRYSCHVLFSNKERSLFSNSGPLTYEAADQLVRQGLGLQQLWYGGDQ